MAQRVFARVGAPGAAVGSSDADLRREAATAMRAVLGRGHAWCRSRTELCGAFKSRHAGLPRPFLFCLRGRLGYPRRIGAEGWSIKRTRCRLAVPSHLQAVMVYLDIDRPPS